MRRAGSLAAVAAALLALGSGQAQARDSGAQLDESFGQAGRVTLPASGVRVTAVAPDGSIILSGKHTLQRLTPEGQLDLSFGEAGTVTPPPTPEGQFQIAGIAVDADGRIIVAGTSTPPQPPSPEPPPKSPPPFEMLYVPPVTAARILRYLPNGTLDPTFGNKGVVETDFGLPAPMNEGEQLAPMPLVEVTGVAIGDANRIVLTGGAGAGLRGGCAHDWFWNTVTYAAFVVRLTESGAPDTSFGDDDGVFGGHDASENPLRAEMSSQPVVASAQGVTFLRGWGHCPRAAGFPGVARLTASGETGGLNNGRLNRGWLTAAVAAPDGSVVFLEEPKRGDSFPPRLFRVEPDGTLRRSFGRAGRAALDLPGGDESYMDAIAVDSRNRVLLAGVRVAQPPRRKGSPRAKPHRSWLLMRMRPQGGLDKTFGNGGTATIRFPFLTGGCALYLDRQGRAVLSGASHRSRDEKGLIVARYLLGG